MPSMSAENYSRQGLFALREGRHKAAADLFRQALDLDKDRNRRTPEMRYLSYYGLSLAKAGLSTQFALQACHKAVKQQKHDPMLHLNLGRVYQMSGRRVMAMQSFECGLRVAPDHRLLRQELSQIDRRSRPVIPALGRDNPINRFLGRLRAGLRGSQAAAGSVNSA